MAYKYLNDDGLKAYTKKIKGALKDLHTPIDISTLNTAESNAQNVRNIADFVAKAKAAGIADVDGMAVTCLLSSGYSGVGYLHFVDGNYTLQGVEIQEELERSTCFLVWDDGSYKNTNLITGDVTSQDLTRGARKPIILTPETTEVDEDTYQKLLTDDVDVVFIASDGEYCALTYKEDATSSKSFYFTCLSTEGGDTMGDIYIYAYAVNIVETIPHTCTITTFHEATILDELIGTVFVHKGYLSPVLQEIDLTGTDAERKAKLAKFEADWKALTGASDLSGARFVGKIQYDERYVCCGIFVWLPIVNSYYAIMSNGSDGGSDSSPVLATVIPSNGAIYTNFLFSHLKPITIKTGSAPADIAANRAAIQAYRGNLVGLGIIPNDGFQVSVVVTSDGEEYTGTLNIGTGLLLKGIVTDVNETHHYPFHIDIVTGIVTFDKTNYHHQKDLYHQF